MSGPFDSLFFNLKVDPKILNYALFSLKIRNLLSQQTFVRGRSLIAQWPRVLIKGLNFNPTFVYGNVSI